MASTNTSWYVEYDDGPDSDYMVMTKTSSTKASSSSTPSPISGTISPHQRTTTTSFNAIPTQLDCNGSTTVVLVFDRDVSSVEICLVDGQTHPGVSTSHLWQVRPPATRVNSRTFTFDAPEHSEGCVDLLVSVDGRQQATRPRLTYRSSSLRLARDLSTLYVHQLDALCQHIINMHGVEASAFAVSELDRLMSASLADSDIDVPVHIYEDLFGIYRMQAAPSAGGAGDVNVALTLLHLAAKWGLSTFTDRLLDLPDSAEAVTSCRDRDGKTPSELARRAGHVTLAERLSRVTCDVAPIETVPQRGNGGPALGGPVPLVMPRSSTLMLNQVQQQQSAARQTVSDYRVSGRAKSGVNQCDDVFSPDVDEDNDDDEYVDTDNVLRQNGTRQTSDPARMAAGTVSPADSSTDSPPATTAPHRKASYVAATNDDDLLLAAEENSCQPLQPSTMTDDQPPSFRPPPPAAVSTRKTAVVPPSVIGTEIAPPPRAKHSSPGLQKTRKGRSEDAGMTPVPPPVAPRTAAKRYSMLTGNSSGTRNQLPAAPTAATSSVPLRNQVTARSENYGTSSDDFVNELDQIVPVPRGNRPKTNRT